MSTQLPPIDLSGLKDIHTPLRPDVWPLASGWYILATGLALLVILGLFLCYRYKRLPLPYAMKELEKIKELNADSQLKKLNQLLKRVAMVKYDRTEVAPLTEENWESFLHASAPDTLTKTQAHELAFSIYSTTIPDNLLYKNCQKWIKKTLKKD